MKLPNRERAIIPERKMVNYLLDETHPTGKHKAIFFQRFGFSLEDWPQLADALREHSARHDVTSTLSTPEGIHYVIEGELTSPDHRNPSIRSVWAIDTGSAMPRFITAYPIEK